MVAGQLTQAMVSMERILKLYRQVPGIVRPDAYELPEARGELRLEDVISPTKKARPSSTASVWRCPRGR